jgi:hypothetical protein
MNHLLSNDQAYIAGQFEISEAHFTQAAFIAFHKIKSYKLSMNNAAYCKSNAELKQLVSKSLFRYVKPEKLLLLSGFAEGELDN